MKIMIRNLKRESIRLKKIKNKLNNKQKNMINWNLKVHAFFINPIKVI